MPSLNSLALQNFYKTSPMREGILNWYPFKKGSSVLEQSDGLLIELLATRCDKVSEFGDELKGEEKFDYVVVIDPNEITVASLKKYCSYLNPHGRLLMAFDNPYGLQYFAGKRCPRTGLPYAFDGKSKAEIENCLKLAGIKGQKWYYPFTNHYFAREIYSDNILPNEFLNHRGQAFIEDDYTKTFDERPLWQEVIRGGAFKFLCNSYLVEGRVSADDAECDVDFAAITAYREPIKAFITTVHSDGTAKKHAVFEEGKARLHSIADNHRELENLGVSILPVAVEDDVLTMKRLDLPTIWDYWTRKLINDELTEIELFTHFDRIRGEIKKSAKDGKCYWELVPANCFYDESKDELIFFDQEYYWEDVDPDLAIIRAVHALIFSPYFHRDSRTKGWVEKLKERYGLTNKWDTLAKTASAKTHEYVFNTKHTAAINKSEEQAKHKAVERQAEQTIGQSRYKQMCVAATALEALKIEQPVIYGYGARGKMLRYALEMNGTDIACIIDKSRPIVRGVPLFATIDEVPVDIKADAIIITPLKDVEQITENIKQKTRCRVVMLEELING